MTTRRDKLIELAFGGTGGSHRPPTPKPDPAPGRPKPSKDKDNRKKERKLLTVNLAEVEPEEVTFLWQPYIPRGKLTLLEGDPAAGKTFLALALAAAVTAGNPLPNPEHEGRPVRRREPENVVFMSAEDGIADTLVPRLLKMEVDMARIFAVQGTWTDDEEGTFSFDDIELLDSFMADKKPALVVIDPLQAFLGAKVDMHRANETRPVLAKLGRLAEKYQCAMLILRHLSKGTATKGIYRGMGSIDFTAAARSVLLAGCDPQDQRNRAIVQIKSSLAPAGPSIGYTLDPARGFLWAGLSPLTAADLLGSDLVKKEKTKMEQAGEFLRDVLKDGPMEAKEIEAAANDDGIAKRTLNRAKKELNIKSFRWDEKPTSPWFWELPEY